MVIDCDTCLAPAGDCAGCMMTALLAATPARSAEPIDLDADEQAALGTLAGAGLVPPLRLVTAVPSELTAEPMPDWADERIAYVPVIAHTLSREVSHRAGNRTRRSATRTAGGGFRGIA